MTLNITLLTERAIYQSADFRLTELPGGRLVTDRSTKLVVLQYPDWHGFVTYTGIGRVRGIDSAAFVCDWLNGSTGSTLDQVVDRIRKGGNSLLDGVRAETGTQVPHTFTLGAFDGYQPQLVLISNYEESNGRRYPEVHLSLSVSRERVGRSASVVVTGKASSVSREERRSLQRLALRYPDDSSRIRDRMVALNVEAARRLASEGAVSPDCTVISFRLDGTGVQDVTGEGQIVARVVANGVIPPDVTDILSEVGARPKLVSIGFQSSRPREPYEACRPHVIRPAEEQLYDLEELSCPDLDSARANNANVAGTILGDGYRSESPAASQPLIWRDGSPALLGFIGRALGLNSSDQVAATVTMADGSARAFRWTADNSTDLGPADGRSSGGQRINDDGMVAGWVSRSADHRGQFDQRPAVWSPEGEVTILEKIPADWGDAIDIDASGLVLVAGHTGIWGLQAILWRPGDRSLRAIGGHHRVSPVALNNDGLVIGFANDAKGESVGLVSNVGRNWELLGTPAGWTPAAISDAGDIVGTLIDNGVGRPWLRRRSGEITWLPYYAHHVCRPTSINTSADVVGWAGTDHGTHALLWRRR